MDQRVCLILLPILAACSGSPAIARVASPSARAQPSVANVIAPAAPKLARLAAEGPEQPALEYDEQEQSDQSYVENSERALALYRQFIERAGSDPHYASAVKHSREQIQDLSNALLFVEQGRAQRTGQ